MAHTKILSLQVEQRIEELGHFAQTTNIKLGKLPLDMAHTERTQSNKQS